jgi:hypothetical protein
VTPSAVFLLQAFVIVAFPAILRRLTRVKGIMPLVTMQIVVGIALGPSVFGKLAPGYFQIFGSPAALAPLAGLERNPFRLCRGLGVRRDDSRRP